MCYFIFNNIGFAGDCGSIIQKLAHPPIFQLGEPTCGASCFISVVQKHGFQTDNALIARHLGYGTVTHYNLIGSFRNYGFRSNEYTPTNIYELHAHAISGTSFILSWRPPYFSSLDPSIYHYSVFEGIFDGHIHYMDPNFGHMKMPVNEFLTYWSDHAIWIQK